MLDLRLLELPYLSPSCLESWGTDLMLPLLLGITLLVVLVHLKREPRALGRSKPVQTSASL